MSLQLPDTARKSFTGAGVLFVTPAGEGDVNLLLAQRLSGIWSIPGGGSHRNDGDAWVTARRETTEEFGSFPSGSETLFSMRFPFGIMGFDWTTFVVRLRSVPDCFPDRQARDFLAEFQDAAWFPVKQLPAKSHWLLMPVLWKLRGWTRRARSA